MRKYYHIYINTHALASTIGGLVLVLFCGSLAYAAIVELYWLDTVGPIGQMWARWHEIAIAISGDTEWYFWIIASPFFAGIGLAFIVYQIPDIKMFRRAVTLAD